MINKIKSFFTSNTFTSALVGAMLTGCVSWFLLSKQIQDAKNEEIRNARISIIRDAEYLFAQAEFTEITSNQMNLNAAVLRLGNAVCNYEISRGKEMKNCDFSHQEDVLNNSHKDFTILSANYKSLSRLTSIYFCQKSINNFRKLNINKDWYSYKYLSLREEIMNSMYEEIDCKK